VKFERSSIALISSLMYSSPHYGDKTCSTIAGVHMCRGNFLMARCARRPVTMLLV
jgi:hypothetical protein